jgi:hypothetical protein
VSNRISLKETERKVFKSAFQDGLVDVSIGCVILMFAIAPFLSPYLGDFWSSAVFLPFWAIVFPGIWLVRKYIVKPRAGTVKYGSWRKTRMIRFNVLMLTFGIFAFALGILSAVEFDAVPGWTHTARFSLILLIAFTLAGYFLNFPRLYLYGVLLALAPMIGELLYVHLDVPHHGYPVVFGAAAGLMIGTGLVLFVRLLRDHPLQPHQAGPQERIE